MGGKVPRPHAELDPGAQGTVDTSVATPDVGTTSARRGQRADQGFTLAEVLVAMFVVSFTLLGLVVVQIKALESVGLARQRQQATALANRTMEQLRSLPYDTVTAGLNSADVTGDPNIQSVAGVLRFRPAYDSSVDEVLQSSSGQAAAPLFPHVQDAGTPGTPTLIGNVQYEVRTYVTQVDPTADLGFHLTVIVSWSSDVTNGVTKTTAVRSQVFSPQGCSSSSTATRPFAGPCQAFFYSDAGAAPAGITVVPLAEGQPLVVGTDVTRIEAMLPSMSARTQSEQIVSGQSIAAPPVASITDRAGVVTSSVGASGVSSADTDPATGIGSAPSAGVSLSMSGPSSLSHGAENGLFTSTVPSGVSGSALSTTAAMATPACPDDGGTALVTNQACSSGEISSAGTYSVTMDLDLLDRNLDPVSLASIAVPTGAPWRSFGARALLPVAGHCTATTGIGCVAAGSRRDFLVVNVGGLPTAGPGDYRPSGFTSMAMLDGFSARATAEAGISPGVGTASRAANTLTYWNGNAYSTTTLGASSTSIPLGDAVGVYRLAGQPDLTIAISGTIEVSPVTTVASGSAPCQVSACTVTSMVGTVRVVVQYDISTPVASLGSFVVTTDLGSAMAQTTYKAAPGA